MAEIELLWWHWVVAGMFLLVIDLLAANTFYLLWLGLGMVLVAGVLFVFTQISPLVQVVVWAVASFVLIGIWRHFRRAEEPDDGVGGMVGTTCIVVSWDGGRGQVRLQRPFAGRDVWEAEGTDAITKGDSCRITTVNPKASRVTLAKD